jgi:hypothetical protein
MDHPLLGVSVQIQLVVDCQFKVHRDHQWRIDRRDGRHNRAGPGNGEWFRVDLKTQWLGQLPEDQPLSPNEWPNLIAEALTRAMAPPDLGVEFGHESRLLRYGGTEIGADIHLSFRAEDRPTGAVVGMAGRSFATSSKLARHDQFDLTAPWRGRNRCARSFRRTSELYEQLGIRTIELEASDIGRYLWAACGFDFAAPWVRQEVLEAVVPFAGQLGFELDPQSIEHSWELLTIPETVRASDIELVADPDYLSFSGVSFAGNEDIRLGKALLLGSDLGSWAAQLDLDGGNPGYRLMRAYTGQGG